MLLCWPGLCYRMVSAFKDRTQPKVNASQKNILGFGIFAHKPEGNSFAIYPVQLWVGCHPRTWPFKGTNASVSFAQVWTEQELTNIPQVNILFGTFFSELKNKEIKHVICFHSFYLLFRHKHVPAGPSCGPLWDRWLIRGYYCLSKVKRRILMMKVPTMLKLKISLERRQSLDTNSQLFCW